MRPRDVLTWPDGRSTGTVPATRAISGGLRLHLVTTLQGLPVAFALAGAKADEREVLAGMFTAGPDLVAARPGQTLIGDKNYYGRDFEAAIAGAGITLLRPARKGESERAGSRFQSTPPGIDPRS